MSDALLNFYHALPAPLRSVAASVRGLQLRSWRYGKETEALIEAALERESWTSEQWSEWQQDQLARLLAHAVTRVPFYRSHWAARRRSDPAARWQELTHWPVLEKDSVRAHPRRFVADGHAVESMYCDHTSGTSGTPLTLWFSRDALRAWYALCEARLRRWHQVSRHDNWAILGGQLVVPTHSQSPPFWVWNAPMRQLYLSSAHLSRQHAPAFVAALNRYRVSHLISYTSSAVILAREALDQGLKPETLRLVLTNAEPLFPWQRAIIREGLRAQVRETYGMAEMVVSASECPAGRMHWWPETGWLEVLDESGVPVAPGKVGRLVSTGFLNPSMPLVRYAVGDRGSAPITGSTCACGKTLPLFPPLEGRTNDVLLTPDGRKVYWLNSVFYGLPVVEAQVIQEQLDLIRVLLVPGDGFDRQAARRIEQRMKLRLGAVQVALTTVTQVPRGANGKFRAIVSRLPPEAAIPAPI